VEIYVGLWKGPLRMKISKGPKDAENRIFAVKLPTQVAKDAERKRVVAKKVKNGAIKLDGKLDEKEWKDAPSTGEFVKTMDGAAGDQKTTAKLLWDDKNLYVLVDVQDADVASQFTKHDDPIWKEDAVELFIDADKNGHGYVELQVNPRNATFDSWFATVRPNGDPKWDSNMVTAVTVDGTLDNRDDVDKGWRAELAIPLVAVKGRDDKMDVRIPPKVGDSWKLDIVRVEKPKDKQLTASAWAQIDISDFHALDRLVTVTFGDDKGKTVAAAEPAPAEKPAEKPADKPKDARPAKPKKETK